MRFYCLEPYICLLPVLVWQEAFLSFTDKEYRLPYMLFAGTGGWTTILKTTLRLTPGYSNW